MADENMPGRLVSALRACGCDVTWIRTAAPGSSDGDVLAMAVTERRVLLTFDKDFGELAANANPPITSGIILLRIPVDRSPDFGRRVASTILGRNDWAGYLAVIEPGRVRMRLLAAPS